MTDVHEDAAVYDLAQPELPPQSTHESMINFFEMKQKMIQQFHQNYQAFLKSLSSFPIMQNHMRIAMDNFEIGFTMFHKGMDLVPFQALQPVDASQPAAPQDPSQELKETDGSQVEDSQQGSTEAA